MANRGLPLDVANRARGLRLRGGSGYGAGASIDEGPGGTYVAPAPPSLDVPPWIVYKPPRGTDFTAFGELTALTVATGQTILTGAVFQVPVANIPVIRSITFDVNLLTPTSNIFFTLLQNGSPVEGWNGVRLFPRTATTISISYGPDETYIVLSEGSLLQIAAEVRAPDAGPYQVGANMHGWYVDVNVADALEQAYNAAGM